MTKYIVELRANKPNSTEADKPEAYLGKREVPCTHPDHPDEMDAVTCGVNKREAATEYDTIGHARNDLNAMPDAFFDRYWPNIVEVA